MYVLAINSSPNLDKGNTGFILGPFLEGMKEAGAEVDLFYTRKLRIDPCLGNYDCWLNTPGECTQKDDMRMLYPKLRMADVCVLATPVYCNGVSGPMKILMDRMIPLIKPFHEIRDGHSCHLRREENKRGKIMLVSTCGFWEMDNFDLTLAHMKSFCRTCGKDYGGALLRPHGSKLKYMLREGIHLDDILAAAKEAGRQLVENGEMSRETLDIVSREILPLEEYIQSINQRFRNVVRALEKESAAVERNGGEARSPVRSRANLCETDRI